MTKESLMEMGLTDEQAAQVMVDLNGSFVTKARFNEVNTALKTAQNDLKDRDAQLEQLKSAGAAANPLYGHPAKTGAVCAGAGEAPAGEPAAADSNAGHSLLSGGSGRQPGHVEYGRDAGRRPDFHHGCRQHHVSLHGNFVRDC